MEILTERLMIRDLRESDYPEFERTLNGLQKAWFGSGKGFLDWLISRYLSMDIVNSMVSFGIFHRQTERFMGTVGAGQHDDLHETEIFYHLLPEYRGQGFATEAARAITGWSLESYPIPYLIGTAAVENVKSQRVLERCGYRLIDTRTLLVHVANERHEFRYYRYDRQNHRG